MFIKFCTEYSGLKDEKLVVEQQSIHTAFSQLKTSKMNGWLHYGSSDELKQTLDSIIQTADYVKENADTFIVVGAGGSYLGSRAVIEALTPHFERSGVRILFAGNNLSAEYLKELLYTIKNSDVCLNIISKSGTTLETDVAFRLLLQEMQQKYRTEEELKQRIVITTDPMKGPLRKFANKNGCQCFDIPENIGGRFSVFTPVGLLPMAVAGIDIHSFVNGVNEGERKYSSFSKENVASLYAAYRNYYYKHGKDIELFAVYEPRLRSLTEWWRQLFGESCGKNGQGLFPSSVCYTGDLHSMGQLVQEGKRNIFETILWNDPKGSLIVPETLVSCVENNAENTSPTKKDIVAGRKIEDIVRASYKGTLIAHEKGGVPSLVIEIKQIDDKNIGQLLYFFMVAVSLSAFALGVNPFDQPGVEAYKSQMRKILAE